MNESEMIKKAMPVCLEPLNDKYRPVIKKALEDVQKYRPQYYMYTQEMYDIINDNTSRPKEDLINYEQELFDRLWYLRTIHRHPELSNFPKAIEVIEKYGEPDDSLDWNYNFISGALATIRWSLNKYDDNKHFLDT